jgi:hypothetical protein
MVGIGKLQQAAVLSTRRLHDEPRALFIGCVVVYSMEASNA